MNQRSSDRSSLIREAFTNHALPRPSALWTKERGYRNLVNIVPPLGDHGHPLGAARPVCDSKFAGHPSQMFVGRPERRARDKGGSEQMRIDPTNTSAVQLV